MSKIKRTKGSLLVELLIGVSIITFCIIAFSTLSQVSLRVTRLAVEKSQAGYLLEEGVEAVKITRDNGWTNIENLSVGTDYYISFNSSTWSFSTTPNTIGKFTRSITLENVYRDANDDIASSGTLDTESRKVTTEVSWTTNNGTQKVESMTVYITNIFSS